MRSNQILSIPIHSNPCWPIPIHNSQDQSCSILLNPLIFTPAMTEKEKQCMTTKERSAYHIWVWISLKYCLLVNFNTRPQFLNGKYSLFTFDQSPSFFFLKRRFSVQFYCLQKKKKRICGKLEIMQQRSSLNHILISSMHKFWAMNYIFVVLQGVTF